MNVKNLDYWNHYYGQDCHNRLVPSQFASFVLNEFFERSHFIDAGCGNARDSYLFDHFGKSVLALDGSEKVIQLNRQAADKLDWKIDFQLCDFSSDLSIDSIVQAYRERYSDPVIYSRFFLHAINDEAIEKFLDFSELMMGESGVLCLEYRTEADRDLDKVTQAHFRNFIDPLNFETQLRRRNMVTRYFCEGHGYAKFQTDDAFVARHIIERRS